MKTFKFIWLIAMIAIFSACKKDNITVTLKTAGELNVQLADSTGTKFENVKVHLYTSIYSSSSSGSLSYSGELDTKRTDANGNVNFGTLAEGMYYVVTDTIKKGNKKYLISKTLQIVSGDSKNLVLNPFEYVGNIKLGLQIYTNGSADTLDRTKIKVALVNALDYSSKLNRSQVINKALVVKSFDATGKVEFNNVPANIRYYPYVYVDNADTVGAWSSNNSIMTSKDNTYSGMVYVYLTDLIIPKANLSLTLQYYNSGYNPVASANVALIKYSDYINYSLNYANVNTILSHAVKTGTTNASGTVIFTDIPASVDFYAYVYYSASLYTWVTYSMYAYTNSSNDYTRSVTGSDLGL